MGVTVREKPVGSGVWWVFIAHGGRRRSKLVGKKSLAEKVAEVARAELALGKKIPDREPKIEHFGPYAENWLKVYIKPLRSHATFERYREVLKKHVRPALGQMRLNEIKRSDIRDFYLKLHAADLTIGSARNVVSGALRYAQDAELIPVNPADGVTKGLGLKYRKRAKIQALDQQEVKLFLDICAEHYPDFYPFFLCGFRTGMRLGELLALEWGDVDWNGQFIEVSKTYKLGRTTTTKTGKSRRVDASDQLLATLKELHAAEKRKAFRAGTPVPELIFHKGGKNIEQQTARARFHRVLEKAGLRRLRVHDIRHTFAGLLLTQGSPIVYVKEQLGHSSISMTVDTYGALIPSANRDEVNRLDTVAPQAHPAIVRGRQK